MAFGAITGLSIQGILILQRGRHDPILHLGARAALPVRRTPGYLGLPVIAMAMNPGCHLRWVPRTDTRVVVTSDELRGRRFDLAALDHQGGHPFEWWWSN